MIDALRYFLAVVETGNLSKAASAMQVAVSSVSRKIDGLEEELGAKLFVRSSRRILLTDAGERFLPRARSILADMAEARASLSELDPDPRGLLTVTVPRAFGRLHVAPAVAAFLQRYPTASCWRRSSHRCAVLPAPVPRISRAMACRLHHSICSSIIA